MMQTQVFALGRFIGHHHARRSAFFEAVRTLPKLRTGPALSDAHAPAREGANAGSHPPKIIAEKKSLHGIPGGLRR